METAVVFPVLPGKSEALIAFANTIMNERRDEYKASQASITKESWHLQSTPMGDLCIVCFESPDPMSVFNALAESQEPFDIWFRQQVLDTTGADLTKPPSGLPTRFFQWSQD
jgi:hypothetical protein